MPLPTSSELAVLLVLLGAVQFLVIARFIHRFLAGRFEGLEAFTPAVSVIVACKGTSPGYEGNIQSLLDQDYGGKSEFLFVCPCEQDPAYLRLKEITHGRKDCRVLTTGKRPETCSDKLLNLLHGIAEAAPESEVFLIADSDMRVPPGWLKRMTSPLRDASNGAATTVMIYIPAKNMPGAWLSSVWMAAGMPYFDLMGSISGQSFAIRRKDYAAWNVGDLWSRSVIEDLPLARLVREQGKQVYYVHRASPSEERHTGLTEMLRGFNKWMTLYRIYEPRVWFLGAAVTAIKAYALIHCLAPPGVHKSLLLLLWGIDAAALLMVFSTLRAAVPGRLSLPMTVSAACWAPALQVIYLINYLASSFSSEIRWGGYTYRMHGPQDIAVVKRPS